MERDNETRPLLPSFEGESWRSRARKRCMRLPSEVVITGIILGVFLIVVTLLIVFENVESEKKDEITMDSKLLASPFKFNKKAQDMSWQEKKDKMKGMKTFKEEKWDNANNGWKKFPDITGALRSTENEVLQRNFKDSIEIPEIPKVDEYGKEIEDSLEELFDLQMSDPSTMKQFNKDISEIKNLLHTKIKWKEIDDGWKKLSDEGWSDRQIRGALFKAIKEKREELMNEDSLQPSMNFGQIWDNIIENWKNNFKEGSKVAELQQGINDEWKNNMNTMQSPKSNKFMKADKGWERLSDIGWKNKNIEDALIEAWEEYKNASTNNHQLLQSPMNIQGLWGKTKGFFNSIFHKGMGEPNTQKKINDEWAKKFNLLQSPMSSYKKWGKYEELNKKDSKDDWKDKADEGQNESEETGQSPMKFEDFMEDIIEKIKSNKGTDEQKSQMELNDEFANEFSLLKSPTSSFKMWKEIDELRKKHSKDGNLDNETEETSKPPITFEDFIKDIIESIKENKKGNKEAEKQKDINDDWKNGMTILRTAKLPDKKWKQVNDHWKTFIEHERNTLFGKNDGDVTPTPRNNRLQQSMPLDNIDWGKIKEEWRKLTGQGGKDEEMKEAVYNAWKNGNKLLQSAMGQNDMKWKKVNEGWKKISNKSVPVPTKCPFSKFHREHFIPVMSAPSIDCALVTEEVRRKYGRCIDLSFLPKECKPSWRQKCFTTYKYRKIDGTCNNQVHPTWGQSGTPFVRMLAPDYADGVSALRTAQDGEPLPNARLLSRKLYSKQLKPDGDTSILFMYFGLFVDHDMVETAVNSDSIPCCAEDFLANPQSRPKECLQIDIPKDDPFYGPKNVECLSLVRSSPVNGVCGGRREQLNKATSFLDGSVVYGSSIGQAKQLRTFSRGNLKTQLINNTPFMPNAEGAGYSCGTPDEPLKCFEAGDSRVNMMVELTAMHTLWHREHNRIAKELLKLNPQWQDEIIYQEARKILIGEFQHITYNEFLPILLGTNAIENYELKIDDGKIYEGYDETMDPSVFNVFGAAAFRFGHSLVPDVQYLLGAKNSTVNKVPLHETFFNAELLYHNGLDLLLRGAAKQKTQSVDSYVSPEVREHLFQPSNLDYGYDLAAVGIQRGRDHGLPPYTKWRSVCGLPDIKTWDDLYNVMDEERANMFKDVYKSVDDIDLIPGALAEHHEAGSLVGPTYTCLIGRQFKKTRKGDRFWFEMQNQVGSFTKGQLDQIYKSNMARIICDNSDEMKTIQKYPFKIPSDNNPILDCDGIQKLDLSEWISNF